MACSAPFMGRLPLKIKLLSRKWVLEKKTLQKSQTDINTCVSLIKEHWKKMTEIPQKHDFLTSSIKNFSGKVEQFVRKYYITWLIDLPNKLYDIS